MIFRTDARATAIAAVAVVDALGAGVVAAPQAAATPVTQEIGYAIAFQAHDSRFINGTNSVWGWRGYFSSGFNATALFAGMAPGTSASVGAQSQVSQAPTRSRGRAPTAT